MGSVLEPGFVVPGGVTIQGVQDGCRAPAHHLCHPWASLPERQSYFGHVLALLGAAGSLPSGSHVDGGMGSAFPISSAAELD